MSAVWLRYRAELRTRGRAWLGLALLVGIVGGAVLGLAAGARRAVWTLFADELGVVPVARVPLLAVLLLVPVAAFVANLVAAVPAAVAAGTRPAQLLRSE